LHNVRSSSPAHGLANVADAWPTECLNAFKAIRIDIPKWAIVRISVAIETAARVCIGHHRINAQEASARRAFVVGEPIFPSPFEDLAQVFAGGLCVKSEFFPRRDFGSRARARQAVSLPVC
jgi:hypothetical protein